jgi:hypothetical protein
VSFQLDSNGILRLDAWRDIPWLLHGFTTRRSGDFGNGAPDAESLRRLGAEGMRLKTVRQIHSNRVYVLNEACARDTPERPEADGLLTALAGQVLGVRTADCLPLLLIDRRGQAIATVHAGWRGTRQAIAAKAVQSMQANFGSEPEALEAAIGPGIAVCCFEVGCEVAEQFDPSLVVSPPPKASQSRSPADLPGSSAEDPSVQPRPHVDLVEANRRQLLEQGIPAHRIWSTDQCTCCQTGSFFSYRRDGDAARMLAFAGIRAV